MTVVPVSDNFNRADGPLNTTGGNWVGRSRTTLNVTSNQLTCTLSSAGVAWHVASYAGEQSVEMTIVEVGASSRVRVLAGVQDNAAAPNDTFNIYAAGEPEFYRWGADVLDYRLVRKIATSSGNTDLFVHSVTPANGHKIKMTWNPTTKLLECFLDTGSGYGTALYSAVQASGLEPPVTHTRVGLHLEDSSIADDWVASYTVDDGGGGGGSGGWEFSEWQGGVAPTGSEVSLTADGEWVGGTAPTGSIVAVNVAASSVYPTDTSTLPEVRPQWSERLRDAFGVNVHYKFSNSSSNVYSNIAQVTAYVLELNPGWVRDRFSDNNGARANQLSQGAILQASDIGFNMSMNLGSTTSDPSQGWWSTPQSYYTEMWGYIAERSTWKWTAAGPNEPNDRPLVNNWINELVAQQKMNFDTRAAYGLEATVPVVAPALKDGEDELPNDFIALGNTAIGDYMDYADFHRYPLSQWGTDPDWDVYQPEALHKTPEYLQQLRVDWTTAAYGKAETFCTEGGFSENIAANIGPETLPPDIQADYAERLFFSLCTPTQFGGLGVRRFFLYELLDDPDPNLNLSQAHWGIIYTPSLSPTTWSKKPAFTRLKTRMNELEDVAGKDAGYSVASNPLSPAMVRFQIECSDSRFRYNLVANYAGQRWVYYWLDKALWNPQTDERIDTGVIAGEAQYVKIGEVSASAYPGGQILDGLSGSCESRVHANSMWMHMERPNSYVWLFDDRNMAHKKTIRLMDGGSPWADSQWEDMAYDPVRVGVWVANCGANSGTTAPWDAAFFTEPATLGSAATVLDVSVTKYKFQYQAGASLPAGGLNCECMMVAPDGRIYFVDKRSTGADGGPTETTLWQAPASLAAYPTVNELVPVRKLGALVNSGNSLSGNNIGRISRGDWAPDNSGFVVADNFNDQLNTPTPTSAPRTYYGQKFHPTTFDFIEDVELPIARKIAAENNVNANPTNENLHYSADSLSIYVGTEGTPPTEVWRVDLPTDAVAGSDVTITTTEGAVSLTATPFIQKYVLP